VTRVEKLLVSVGIAAIFLLLALFSSHAVVLLWDGYRSTHRTLNAHQRSVYEHMTDDQVQDLLAWTVNPGFVYEPWLGFREKSRRSAYVNVSDLGIRFNEASVNPDNKIESAVWFFGGSTAFGWGVADNETIPAQLQQRIQQPVINFGRANYYSAHENFLFSSLLKSGYAPRAAVFFDGINEMCDIIPYRTEFTRLFVKAQTYGWDPTEAFKPLFRIAQKVQSLLDPPRRDVLPDKVCVRHGKTLPLSTVIAGNLLERQDTCRRHALKCLVFVQPFAGVHGVHQDYATLSTADRKQMAEKFAYLSPTWRAFGAVFLANSLDTLREHAYVDGTHYSAPANAAIATAIASHLR